MRLKNQLHVVAVSFLHPRAFEQGHFFGYPIFLS